MNKTIIVVVIILVVLVGGIFFLKSDQPQPQTPLASTSDETTDFNESNVSSEIKEITISGNEFIYSPGFIGVKAGERIRITFENNGKYNHDLVFENIEARTKIIGGGQTDIIEFTAPTSGTYAFFCSVPGHRVSGMEGQLKVE